jgi:acyl transferase domain-containing protein
MPDGPADIAVVGMAGRFPGAEDVDELWADLAAGVSAIREIPESRWSSTRFFDPDPACLTATYCNRGGFLDDVDRFDAPFFNISGKEAEQTDPQQRLFLEEAWRALEDAGYTGEALNGSSCGVFVGAGASEYLTRMNQAAAVKQAQAFWGNEASILAARISYFLNLKGPSIAVNTACSSSLVALHLACQSLLAGETEMALAGGAFITLAPDYLIVASNGNMLSPEGRCKTFDASADGFGPGEGVGVLVLKPLDRALRDGDQIHGVIKATAINQDGRTNGITAPSGLAQTDVELAAYRRAGIDPATIGYVEAHGTGTPLGDPIEIEALTNAFRAYTDRTGFCQIGSIKTNIGHTAAAAGVAGVIKVLLSFRHGKIPPSLNFTQPNPLIDFEHSPFTVNTRLRDWTPDGTNPRRAAVSSFGFSGTNAHVVLEESPRTVRSVPAPRARVAIPVSAHTPSALEAQLDRLASWLEGPGAKYPLSAIAYNLQVLRVHREYRAVFVTHDISDLVRQIRSQAPDRHEDGELGDLTSRYLAGDDVDWRALWAGESSDRIPLPSYAFDRHRYWFVDTDTVYATSPAPAPTPAPGSGTVSPVRSRPVDAGSNGKATTPTTTDDVPDVPDVPVADHSAADLRQLLRMLQNGEIDEADVEVAMAESLMM